jgi:hypothetical protein
MSSEAFIERRIVTGLIVSTEYMQQIESLWKTKYLESETARTLSQWCWGYFKEYREAPGKNIEGIYTEKIKNLSKTQAQDIEDILAGLSDEYERKQFNVQYLVDQTCSYFKERALSQHAENIQDALRAGDLTEAERLAQSFSPVESETNDVVDPLNAKLIKRAFTESTQPLIRYPKALGRFWNKSLARDSFVTLMGPEKRGKSFWLMDLALRAVMSDCNTVMFQAGDMTAEQWTRRVCISLAGRSDDPDYCSSRWVPTLDCFCNQTDTCDRAERECSYGVFPAGTDRDTLNYDVLVDRAESYPEYLPCFNCPNIQGAVWMQKTEDVPPLDWREAARIAKKWKNKHEKRMRLATYPNETLTVSEIVAKLDLLERQENFIPDVILIDYVDILAPDPDCSRLDKLEQINRIWQRLRKLSQERHCLVISATQAAATAYDKESMSLKDFSDNKKKYAHVTATYALNQTDVEKKLGIMRIGKMVVREEEFDRVKQIHVIQHLHRGRVVVDSYF